ncbi:hypothetical protein GQ457_12G006570 [Hibiscus cannabinus]
MSPRCALKVDLHKAFDSFSWSFLVNLLEALGLHVLFRGWTQACFTESRFFVCLNGSLVGFFQGKRGIRQGDPLSSYLFVMVMNVLSHMLDVAALNELNVSKSELYIAGVSQGHKQGLQRVTEFSIGSLHVRQVLLPSTVIKKVEQLCCRFLWRGSNSPTHGVRLMQNILIGRESLWITWVKEYVMCGADFCFLGESITIDMANKRKRIPKSKETRKAEGGTTLGDLPEHVILMILSFLPLREAVRTCILSRRWKDAFTWISDINLDASGKDKSLRKSFMNFMDRFLLLREDIRVDRFRFHCRKHVDNFRINGWIHYALRHGVRELDLRIHNRGFTHLHIGVFTCKTLHTLRLSFLYRFFIPHVPANCHLPGLKVLKICFLKFQDDGSLTRLIRSCNSLEELILGSCELTKLSVCNPKLKRLTITGYDGPSHEVEINTPNLVYLKYCYFKARKHSFLNLNSLSEARLVIGSKHSAPAFELMRAISHVDSLELTCDHSVVEATMIPTFPNLTYLKLNGWYAGWPNMVASCPSLETLAFDFQECNEVIRKEVGSCSQLHHIKAIKLFAFERKQVELLEHLFKEATVLESLTIVRAKTRGQSRRVLCKQVRALPKVSTKCRIVIT